MKTPGLHRRHTGNAATPYNHRLSFGLSVVVALFSAVLALYGSAHAAWLTYYYDRLGRLHSVSNTGGDAAIYKYDKVGNLTSIANTSSSTVSIFGFSPTNAQVGVQVIIYGDG